MKKKIIYLSAMTLIMSSCYNRIGDLNMVSNRNIDASKDYVLLERNVKGKSRKKKDALERAIDKATEEHNGEYLMNVKVYVKYNGRKIKVEGDVWGEKDIETIVNTSVKKNIQLNTADNVTFKVAGKILEGTIIGINNNGAIVEYKNSLGQTKKKEISFEKLTKIER